MNKKYKLSNSIKTTEFKILVQVPKIRGLKPSEISLNDIVASHENWMNDSAFAGDKIITGFWTNGIIPSNDHTMLKKSDGGVSCDTWFMMVGHTGAHYNAGIASDALALPLFDLAFHLKQRFNSIVIVIIGDQLYEIIENGLGGDC